MKRSTPLQRREPLRATQRSRSCPDTDPTPVVAQRPSQPRRSCGKRRYPDRVGAELALTRIWVRDKGRTEKMPRRAYECALCDGGWHLTSAERTARPRQDTGPSRKVRALVYERDGHRCVRCGSNIKRIPHSIQHRRGRGMGGTRRADTNSPAALLTVCGSGTTKCHGHIEAHPHEALGNGWRIPQSAANPAEWRVWVQRRGWVLLDDDGGWRPA